MLNGLMRWLLAGLLLSGFLSTTHAAAADPDSQRWVPGQILVEPRTGIGENDFEAVLESHGAHDKGRIGPLDVHIVSVPAQAEAAVANALSRNPQIRFAELDLLLAPVTTTANDTYYGSAWHLATMEAPTAWDSSLGDGIVVAVLDTGVDASHPDLEGQLVPGWNLYDNNPDTADVHGHGTQVAGVIAARSNNGIGVTSIAWNARVMPVRISGLDGWASTSTIASGLIWAADHGARVANISYAISGSNVIKSAAHYMRGRGGVVCAAVGNSGNELSTAPAADIIIVSATNSSDTLASWSSYGSVVDVAAPGAGIWTTRNGGSYGAVSGTSFSSPATAATVALIMSRNPALAPEEVEDILMSSSVDLGAPGQDDFFGYGRVDAAAAVAAAGDAGGQPVPEPDVDTIAPTVEILSPGAGSTVTGKVTINIAAQDNVAIALVKCYIDDALKGTTTADTLSCSWNTRKAATGTHTLRADAEDTSGLTASTQIQVEVGTSSAGGGRKGRRKK
jgi:subtilisin family serine protease